MAADEYDPNGGGGGYDPNTGAPPPTTTPTLNGQAVTREFVIAQYMRWLGRPPESEDVIKGWMNNPGGPVAVATAISNSPESRVFAAGGGRGPNPNPTPGDPPAAAGTQPKGGSLSDPAYVKQLIAWASKQPGVNPSVINDPNYWSGAVSHFNGDEAYFIKRMFTPEGGADSGGNLGDLSKGGLLDPFTEPFNAPDTGWTMPDLPTFDFKYADFNAPDPNSILDDKSFQFRKSQGEQSLTNASAASGLLRSGGTLKDFINYGQNFASNEYNNIYNRDLTTYGTNEKKAFDTATTDFGAKLTGYTTTAAARQRQAETDWQHAWDQYMGKFDIYKSNHQFPADVLLRAAGVGASGGS